MKRYRGERLAARMLSLVVGISFWSSCVAQDIYLGQSAALKGADAHTAADFAQGAQAYFDAVNSNGGVSGRKIVLTKLDDAGEASKSLDNTNTFIADARVLALFGYSGSAATASLPLTLEAKIPLVGVPDGTELLRAPTNRYVFNVRAGQLDELEAIIRHIRQVPNARVAVAHSNTPEGSAGLAAVENALARDKLKLTAKAELGRSATAAVTTISAARPDAIVVIGNHEAVAAFIKQYKAREIPTQFFSVSAAGTHTLAKALGSDAEGVALSQIVPPPTAKKYRVVNEYLAALQAQKLAPSYVSLEGFIAAKVVVEALRRGGAGSREALARSLESLRRIDVGGMVVSLETGRRTGSSYVELVSLNKRGEVRY